MDAENKLWRERRNFVVLFVLLTWLAYIWFASAGQMSKIPRHTRYFDRQADAFAAGQLHLLYPPVPEITDADFAEMRFPRWAWDLCPHKGRLYTYWGPIPSLFTLAVKQLGGFPTVGDEIPALFFVCLRLGFSAALLFTFWCRYWSRAPFWPVLLGLGVLAWSTPTPFMLGRLAAYEAAIVAAQAFLVAGVYFALEMIGRSGRQSAICAVLCGTSLGLAFNTRLAIAPAIAVVALAAAWISLPRDDPWRSRLRRTLLIGVPLGALVFCAGLYNYWRFDSFFTTGQNRALTFPAPDGKFLPRYFLADLYSYLFRPPHLTAQFPFFNAEWTNDLYLAVPSFLQIPEGAWLREPMVGFVFSAPFFALAGVATVFAVRRFRALRSEQREQPDGATAAVNLMLVCGLSLAFVAPAPLLFFHAATMRYMGDAATGLALMATIGLGVVLQDANRIRRTFFATAAVVLASYTVVVGVLLGVRSYFEFFAKANPELFRSLSDLF